MLTIESKKTRVTLSISSCESLNHSIDLLRFTWQGDMHQQFSQGNIQGVVMEIESFDMRLKGVYMKGIAAETTSSDLDSRMTSEKYLDASIVTTSDLLTVAATLFR
jgi:hypothetical protein